MKNSSACLATLFTLASPGLVFGLEHGSFNVVQLNTTNNNQTTATPATELSVLPGATPYVSIRGLNSSRGDVDIAFTQDPTQDTLKGVMITAVSENGRNNSSGGGPVGITYGSSHAEVSPAGFYIPTHALPGGAESGANQQGGGEFNVNVAAVRFPFAEGWLAGYTTVTTTAPIVTVLTASPGIALGAGAQVIERSVGVTDIDLRALNSHGVPATSANGVLLTIGARNGASVSLARSNADGTFTVSTMDNGPANPTAYIQDRIAFAYVPVAAAGKGHVKAVGRIRSDAAAEVGSGNFTVAKQGTGEWLLTIPGETNESGTLIVTADGGVSSGTPNNTNNYASYEWDETLGGWLIQSRDLGLTTAALEDGATAEETMFSFAFFTEESAIALTNPAHEAVVTALRPLTLTAAPTGATPAAIQQIEFFVNGQSVGTDNSAPFQINYSYPIPGVYDIEARATLQGGAVVSSVQHKVRAEAYTAAPAMPGYSAAILDGGDKDVTATNPANPAPNWIYGPNTPSPFGFTNPGNASGKPVISVNGAPVPFNSGILLATNYAGNNFGDTTTRGSIDNIATAANDNGNYSFTIRDVLQVQPVPVDPEVQLESGRTSIGFFPYADGWIGAHVNADTTLSSSANLPPNITITRLSNGTYQIYGLPTDGNLIAFTSGEDSDNVACSTQRGINWIVESRDNSQALEDSAFSFLFIPKETRQVLSGKVAELGALTPLNAGLQTVGATVVKVAAAYEIQFGDGTVINPSTAALFVCSDTDAGPGDDNVHWYHAVGNKFVVLSQDMPNLAGGSQAGGFRFLAVPFAPVEVNDDEVQIATITSVAKERTPNNKLEFLLTRMADIQNPLTVNYSVGGTTTNGEDYETLPLTVTFAAGETTATITVNVIDDNVFEADETFTIELQPGAGYSLSPAINGSGVIYNADSIVPMTTVSFQNGVDGYTGTFAKSIGKDDNRRGNGTPIYAATLGSASATLGMDGYPGHRGATPADDSPDHSVMMRFDNLFGTEPGQIPPGAKIAKAYLELTTSNGSNSQSGGPFVVDRLEEPVDAGTTYQAVDGGAAGFEGLRNISTGYPAGGFGQMPINQTVSADISEIVRAWAETPAETPNFGVAIYTGGTTDGWTICSQSHSSLASRPRLVVSYVLQQTKTYTFTADQSSRIVGSGGGEVPSEDGSLISFAFLDLTTNGTTQEALMRFPIAFGDLEDQIPANEEIVRAELVIATSIPLEAGSLSAQSTGPIAIHRMLTDWTVATTFGTTGPRLGTEIDRVITTASGMGQGTSSYFDISSAVQGWKSGQPNYGVNIKPQTEDGWQMIFPGSNDPTLAPYVRVITVPTGTGEQSGFEQWAASNGITGAAQSSDADRDGISALVEYALGLDPKASSVLPGYQVDAGNGTISFTKGAAAAADSRVSYKIQSSTDLGQWDDEIATTDNASVISLTAPVGGGKKFYRLLVSYSAF